jgi:hypothetical protein
MKTVRLPLPRAGFDNARPLWVDRFLFVLGAPLI